jgi:cbb3-type cytochrome oxidase maturation protein
VRGRGAGTAERGVNSIYLLVPLAGVLVAIAIAAFVWAVRNAQFDDLDTPAVRMLLDDENDPEESSTWS